MAGQAKILEGVRVLEWAILQMGPVAGALLSDLGADVIKIEHPVTGDQTRGVRRVGGATVELDAAGRQILFESWNRGKRGITLNLRGQEGRDILHRLVEKSDVFICGFRREAAQRVGADYQTLCRCNPRLIYLILNTFGAQGPDSGAPGVDLSGQARSGIMGVQRPPGEAPFSPVTFGDELAGVFGAYGVLAALLAREHSGIGQEVHASILGAAVSLLNTHLTIKIGTGKDVQYPDRSAAINPLYNVYRASDGKWLCLALAFQADRDWPKVCSALGLEGLGKDPRFGTLEMREKYSRELIAILDGTFSQAPRDKWLELLKAYDISGGPVNTLEDVLSDVQVLANKYVVDYEHPSLGKIQLLGFPVAFSQTPCSIRSAAPAWGQHTEEVLEELLSLTMEEIGALRTKGVI